MYLTPRVNEIKRRRESAMLSQHGLSLKAGLSGQSINRIKRGESRLTHHLRAAAIAQALGCKVEDIFYVDKKQQSA